MPESTAGRWDVLPAATTSLFSLAARGFRNEQEPSNHEATPRFLGF